MGLPDLYSGGKYRGGVTYMDNNCIMGDSGSFSHFCAYNKRIKGWIGDHGVLLIDRPPEDDPVDREVILVQLEYWDPSADPAVWDAIAQTALPGAAANTPVVAAVFLRLGGDGRVFDIVELRGRGQRFSSGISPSRVVISNAIDPLDDTRYAENEVEGAGTTAGVLERYRRKVHLLSGDLTQATVGTSDATYDFATDANFAEVGLTAEVVEWGTGSTSAGSFDVARLRLRWDRGPAINLGFKDATPDWQSQDIALIRPEDIDADGNFLFPDVQDDQEFFRRPPEGAEPLNHKIAVRVWNFGDATAENVQLGLIRRIPEAGGAGDWVTDAEFEELLPAPVPPSDGSDPSVVAFDWPVAAGSPSHLCFRAQIGDRDVPRDDNGVALASDDTDASNDWTQQNVFVLEAPADSPPEAVEATFEVNNTGSYVETVTPVPYGLGEGATLTVTPARLTIAPRSRGLFRIKVELDERLLYRKCGKDIEFLLRALRDEDHDQEPWGASKIIVKPRFRTETVLNGTIMPQRLRLFGHVAPDVGAQDVLLQVERPGEPTLWTSVPLGPGASYDWEMEGDFPSNTEVRAVAYYDGSFDHAKSVSDPVTLSWQQAG